MLSCRVMGATAAGSWPLIIAGATCVLWCVCGSRLACVRLTVCGVGKRQVFIVLCCDCSCICLLQRGTPGQAALLSNSKVLRLHSCLLCWRSLASCLTCATKQQHICIAGSCMASLCQATRDSALVGHVQGILTAWAQRSLCCSLPCVTTCAAPGCAVLCCTVRRAVLYCAAPGCAMLCWDVCQRYWDCCICLNCI